MHQYTTYASSNKLSLPILTAKSSNTLLQNTVHTKMSQQYKKYGMSRNQLENFLHSLSDCRNDIFFADKGVLLLSHNLDEDNIFIEDFRNLMKIIILMLIKIKANHQKPLTIQIDQKIRQTKPFPWMMHANETFPMDDPWMIK
ncbi:uncharacterized protein LOC136077982 isoform X2 [Hydra vulgaris]|uniref:Uncharacterized protein LOC136077982 isoform X2 n=1 Tax=Hydra vulgaris TaxID=6087 RepID=A0ABM4BHR1_HYDVU